MSNQRNETSRGGGMTVELGLESLTVVPARRSHETRKIVGSGKTIGVGTEIPTNTKGKLLREITKYSRDENDVQ